MHGGVRQALAPIFYVQSERSTPHQALNAQGELLWRKSELFNQDGVEGSERNHHLATVALSLAVSPLDEDGGRLILGDDAGQALPPPRTLDLTLAQTLPRHVAQT